MKKTLLTLVISFAAAVVSAADSAPAAKDGGGKAEPPKLAASKTRIKCTVCNGKGSLKASPPDVGQFTGKINDRSHWDVKLDPCPICKKGHG